MTRADSSEPSTGTDTDDVDTVLTETEFETMGWPADIDGVDSGVDRVYVISSSLSNTGMLDSKEAQALAFRAIADVGRQRTADETGMSTSEVDREAPFCAAKSDRRSGSSRNSRRLRVLRSGITVLPLRFPLTYRYTPEYTFALNGQPTQIRLTRSSRHD